MAAGASPTIYYLGNKLRVASKIESICVEKFGKNSSVLDLFAGSGSMSSEFSKNRRVVSNDVQTYSYLICRALLENDNLNYRFFIEFLNDSEFQKTRYDLLKRFSHEISLEKLLVENPNPETVKEYLGFLDQGAREKYADAVIISYYGGLYFALEQACVLQALLKTSGGLSGSAREKFLAALISTASRITYSVGNQFAQPMNWFDRTGSLKKFSVSKFVSKRKVDVLKTFFDCLLLYTSRSNYSNRNKCLLMTDVEAIREIGNDIDFIYADPPYGREHYSRFYHVLETIALADTPSVSARNTMIRSDRYQSGYSIRSVADSAFRKLFSEAKTYNIPIALSYADDSGGHRVENRVMSIESLRSIASDYYPNVEIIEIDTRNYSQLNSKSLSYSRSRKNSELLIIGF